MIHVKSVLFNIPFTYYWLSLEGSPWKYAHSHDIQTQMMLKTRIPPNLYTYQYHENVTYCYRYLNCSLYYQKYDDTNPTLDQTIWSQASILIHCRSMSLTVDVLDPHSCIKFNKVWCESPTIVTLPNPFLYSSHFYLINNETLCKETQIQTKLPTRFASHDFILV